LFIPAYRYLADAPIRPCITQNTLLPFALQERRRCRATVGPHPARPKKIEWLLIARPSLDCKATQPHGLSSIRVPGFTLFPCGNESVVDPWCAGIISSLGLSNYDTMVSVGRGRRTQQPRHPALARLQRREFRWRIHGQLQPTGILTLTVS
jgi:hypothetical protein